MAKKKEHPAPPVEPVQLKRMWNLEPPVYLTIIWSAIIIAVFFIVAILPGAIKSGRYYTISSPVEGSAIYLDGEYLGSGTITEFVQAGDHTLSFDFRDIASTEIDFKVRNKVVFTHLFPKKYEVSSPYFLNDAQVGLYLDSMFTDVVAHSAILSYDNVYHYPPIFSFAVQTALAGNDSQKIVSFMKESALFVTSQEMRADYLTSLDLLNSSGVNISELEAVKEKLEKLTYSSEEKPSSLSVQNSSSYTSQIIYLGEEPIKGYTYPSQKVTIGRNVTDPVYPGVQESSVTVDVPSFTISESEVSEYLYALFLEENPSWAKESKDNLIAEGLVDDSYLDGVYPTTSFVSATPIRNISWYAATAFTDWVREKTGKTVTLLSEAQFTAAVAGNTSYADSITSYIDGTSPSGLFGGVWEMTSDSFIPLERYLGYAPQSDIDGTMIVMKGGSYVNSSDSIDRATIGLIKKDECSDTAGFRIVW